MTRTNPVLEPRSLARARFNVVLAVVLSAIALTSVILLATHGEPDITTIFTSVLGLAALSGFTTHAVTGLRTAQREHRDTAQH